MLRAPPHRPDGVASQLADDLRSERCMAIELDTARIDPFTDAYGQWDDVARAGAYDVVFSVGGLMPAAVALGAVAQLPVVVVNHPPGRALVRLLRGEVVGRRLRTVLEAEVDQVRRLTTTPMEVGADEPFAAEVHHRHGGQEIEATWLHLTPTDPASDPAAVVTTDDGPQVPADQCRVAERRGVVLKVGIDGRWSHARSLTVRALPGPLHVVVLEEDTP